MKRTLTTTIKPKRQSRKQTKPSTKRTKADIVADIVRLDKTQCNGKRLMRMTTAQLNAMLANVKPMPTMDVCDDTLFVDTSSAASVLATSPLPMATHAEPLPLPVATIAEPLPVARLAEPVVKPSLWRSFYNGVATGVVGSIASVAIIVSLPIIVGATIALVLAAHVADNI